MAFADVFHQVTGNARIAGRNIAYVRCFVKKGGLLDGHKGIHIGLIYNPDIYLYENSEPVAGFNIIASAYDTFHAFFAQGMSEVVPELLLANPAAVGELDYNNNKIIASPLAKRIAKEKNIDLAAITGSGPRGRIIKRDVIDTGFKPNKFQSEISTAPVSEPGTTPTR